MDPKMGHSIISITNPDTTHLQLFHLRELSFPLTYSKNNPPLEYPYSGFLSPGFN